MSRAAASRDVRWCRSSPAGSGLLSPGSAHNTPVQAALDRPAALLELACLRVGKLPYVSILSLTSGHYSLRHGARLCIPDVGRILGDGAITGELPGTGDIQDRLTRPSRQVGVQFDQLTRRAVARADCQRAVHHKFHVARAAGFIAGGRNLV